MKSSLLYNKTFGGGEKMSEDSRKAIDKMMNDWAGGLKRGDIGFVNTLYTEDAVQLPPDRDMIRGRQKIKEFHSGAIQMGFEDAVMTDRNVSVSGDVAYEIGNYIEKFHPKGKEAMKIRGKYLCVFKRTADGWKIDREIWNILSPR
jgi:uncharacterized protein (TIGR02246 family)